MRHLGVIASAIVPALSNTVLPVATMTLSGSPVTSGFAGAVVLATTNGTWSPAPSGYTYQWQFFLGGVWSNKAGATAATYTPLNNEGNIQWRAAVTATSGGGVLTTAYSNALFVSQAAPVNSVAPIISQSGSGNAGSTTLIVTNPGTWSPVYLSLTYQWQFFNPTTSAWTDVFGATASSYVPDINGGALQWRVRLVGTNVGGSSAPVASNSITLVQLPPVNTVAPVASGSGGVGSSRTCSPGTWSPTALSYLYKWYYDEEMDGTFLSNENLESQMVAMNIAGNWKCLVTATNAGGSTTAWSNTVTVPGPPVYLSGGVLTPEHVAYVGYDPFTVTPIVWRHQPTSIVYGWQVFNPTTSTWSTIPGQTSSTYDPTAEGQYRATVLASNAYGSTWYTTGAYPAD